MLNALEKLIELSIFRARWLLAPMYLGLAVALVLCIVKFYQVLYETSQEFLHIPEADFVVDVLGLVDSAMLASLVVMVMISGYESTISKLELGDEAKDVGWVGKMGAAELKVKIATSIVAISSIRLLKTFLGSESIENIWPLCLGHLTFVVSAVLLASVDRIAHAGKK